MTPKVPFALKVNKKAHVPVAVDNACVKYKTVLTREELKALEGETLGCIADYVSKDDCNNTSHPMRSFAKVTFPLTHQEVESISPPFESEVASGLAFIRRI